MTAEQVVAGITAALRVGAVTADIVAVEARRATMTTTTAAAATDGGGATDRYRGAHGQVREQRVVSLTQRRLTDPAAVIAGLPPDTRPLPSVAAYDELLPRRRTPIDPAGSDAKVNTS